jgi:large subunit ribosomal protein L27
MAHTKAGGSTKLGRESESKRLGVKLFAGEAANPGNIIIRQRGTKYLPGAGVRKGADDTIYAVEGGVVSFSRRTKKRFDGKRRLATVVSIVTGRKTAKARL